MDNEILKGIIDDIKALRIDTNERSNLTNQRLDGLNTSIIVLQQGVNEVLYELEGVKQIHAGRVIRQNDSIALQTREGQVIYGAIKRVTKE